MTKGDEEPLLGDEILRIVVEKYFIHFELEKSVLQIGGEFFVKFDGAPVTVFKPSVQEGPLGLLWKLIGAKVVHIEWGKDIGLVFDIGAELKIPSAAGVPRGTLLGRSFLSYDDF